MHVETGERDDHADDGLRDGDGKADLLPKKSTMMSRLALETPATPMVAPVLRVCMISPERALTNDHRRKLDMGQLLF